MNSETVTSPPSAVIRPAPMIEGEAEEGQTLTVHISPWAATPPRSVSYQWELCGGAEVHEALGSECVNIDGATSPSLQLTGEDVGYTVRAIATIVVPHGALTSESVRAERFRRIRSPVPTGK